MKQQCPHCDGELEFVQQIERRRRVRGPFDIKNVLSVMVVVIWAYVQFKLLSTVIDQDMREMVSRMLGTLDAALVYLWGYHFGRSQDSDDKTEELARRAEKQDAVAERLAEKVATTPTEVKVTNAPTDPVPVTGKQE